MKTTQFKNGQVKVTTLSGDNIVEKFLSKSSAESFVSNKLAKQELQSGVKFTGSMLDEFGIKPYITEPIKG